MFVAVMVTVAVAYAIATGIENHRKGGFITRRPYGNIYNDASAARSFGPAQD